MLIIHLTKNLGEILSITIGINLWFVPQISEHCPNSNPARLIKNLIWFSRPGVASIFTPTEGIVQECNTSAAVIRNRIWELYGRIVRLSTSNKRNLFNFISLIGIIYESNSKFLKSVYS